MKRQMSLPGHDAARKGANCPEILQLIKRSSEKASKNLVSPGHPTASARHC